MCRILRIALHWHVLFGICAYRVQSFYLPGVAPQDYAKVWEHMIVFLLSETVFDRLLLWWVTGRSGISESEQAHVYKDSATL